MRRWIAPALAALLASVAYGHTPLKASRPAADGSVAAPKVIELEFNGDVRLTSVSVTDAAGVAKRLEAAPTAIARVFSLAVHEPLAPGVYELAWRAVGGDTHIVSGEFSFTVVAAPLR